MLRILTYFSFVMPLLRALQSTESPGAQDNIPTEILTRIVNTDTDVTVDCFCCEIPSLQWTYKSRNSNYKDVAKGEDMIRTTIHGQKDGWCKLAINYTACTYSLLLQAIEVEAAGLFSCWKGSFELRKTNLIVINDDIKCEATSKPSQYGNIFLAGSDSAIINCTLKYSSDESCIVTPIWTDLTGYRDFTIPDDDFEVKMDDKYAWIYFKPGADVANGTHFNLSFTFNCSSFSNNSLDARQQGLYDFGTLEFIFTVERRMTSALTYALLSGLTAVPIIVVAIILLKKQKKLCFATQNLERRNMERYELPKELPETITSNRYLRIKKEFCHKGIRIYEDLQDEGYDIIRDSAVVTSNVTQLQICNLVTDNV